MKRPKKQGRLFKERPRQVELEFLPQIKTLEEYKETALESTRLNDRTSVDRDSLKIAIV